MMEFDKSKNNLYKLVTVEDILAALERNGIPKIQGHYFEYVDGHITDAVYEKKVVAACAVGQIAINLGVDPEDLNIQFVGLLDDIVSTNDTSMLSFQEIAKKAKEWVKEGKYPINLNDSKFVHKAEYVI